MEDLLLWEPSVEELLLCFLREDGAGELKWNFLHLDPRGTIRELQQLLPGLSLLGWARQLSPEQMFEACGCGVFFLEIAPSAAAAALPKLAALLLEQKHWMLEVLCQPVAAPRCCQQSCARPGTLCHGAPSPSLGGVLGVTPSCVLAPNSLSWLHKDSGEIASVFVRT